MRRKHAARAIRGAVAALIAISAVGGWLTSPSVSGKAEASIRHVPTYAFYYIWFDRTSWNRAKIDVPLLGPYSSDDVSVMRTHVKWAKRAGIDGFIVSWKGTRTLDRRLATLVQIARQENFKLSIIYEGLDFHRRPQPVANIIRDMRSFADRYGKDPVFDGFGTPLVIFSGTWEYTTDQVRSVVQSVGSRLTILASEKNASDYQRLAHIVKGDAYYWSSVNPSTQQNYPGKLVEMGRLIHETNGIWIAPAAPGFDARLLGGSRVIKRDDGQTLLTEINAALSSSPDVLGLISWNEFSENSQLEPSRNYGDNALKAVAQVSGQGDVNFASDFASDETSPPRRAAWINVLPLVLVGLLGMIALRWSASRRSRARVEDSNQK